MIDTYHDVEVREPPIQIAGRFLGIVVFLVGIGMLALTFMLAFKAFNNPDAIVPLSALSGKEALPPAAIYVPAAMRIVMLFAMGYFASLIAGRGAHLFFSAKQVVRRVASGD